MATGPTRNVDVGGYYRKDGTYVGGYTQGRRAADAWKNAGLVGATAAGSGVAALFTFVEFGLTLICAVLMTLTAVLTWLMGLQIAKALGLKKPKKPRAAKPWAAPGTAKPKTKPGTGPPRTGKAKPAAKGRAGKTTARTIADVLAQQEARRTARRQRWQGRRQRAATALRAGASRARNGLQRARAAVAEWRARRAARRSS